MLNDKLAERNIPDVMAGADAESWRTRREEILKLYSDEVYGRTPEFKGELYSFVEKKENSIMSGQASREIIRLSFMTPNGMFSFPFTLIIPKKKQPVPAFVHINFALPTASVEHFPQEMIVDEGYALAILCYKDVTSDTDECDGLARAYDYSLNPSSQDEKDSSAEANGSENDTAGTHWGKIGMWAFAASRVMDYILTRPEIDGSRVAVSGHSRLGKTALWCGAQDERFAMVISNNSGCTGAALHRGKVGENVYDITSRFPYWFCRNYQSYCGKEDKLPVDQHMLLACIAPRAVYVNSALEDEWADPQSEYLSAAAASEVWEKLGCAGLLPRAKDGELLPEKTEMAMALPEKPEVNVALPDGEVAYRLREGIHFMGRSDWAAYIEYRKLHDL